MIREPAAGSWPYRSWGCDDAGAGDGRLQTSAPRGHPVTAAPRQGLSSQAPCWTDDCLLWLQREHLPGQVLPTLQESDTASRTGSERCGEMVCSTRSQPAPEAWTVWSGRQRLGLALLSSALRRPPNVHASGRLLAVRPGGRGGPCSLTAAPAPRPQSRRGPGVPPRTTCW